MTEIDKIISKKIEYSNRFENEFIKYAVRHSTPFYKRWLVTLTLKMYHRFIGYRIVSYKGTHTDRSIIVGGISFQVNIMEVKAFGKKFSVNEFTNEVHKNKRIVKRILKN